jgi:hypothetical protein
MDERQRTQRACPFTCHRVQFRQRLPREFAESELSSMIRMRSALFWRFGGACRSPGLTAHGTPLAATWQLSFRGVAAPAHG